MNGLRPRFCPLCNIRTCEVGGFMCGRCRIEGRDPNPLARLTDHELIADLLGAGVTLHTHATRCGSRCQDYRDAAKATDVLLDEMLRRQTQAPANGIPA